MKLDKMLTPPIKASVISFLFAFALIAANTARATYYVDPTNGVDDVEHDGTTWATAKKSLVEVMKLAKSGDTVLAAEGVYETEETVVTLSGHAARFRVSIPAGVTLVATGACERTVIRGANATTSQYNGCGLDSVACVHLAGTGAAVQGFTLRDGRAWYTSSSSYLNAGGVYAADGKIVDCRLIGNKAYRAPAGNGGTWVRCYFSDNDGSVGRGVESASAYNCVFDAHTDYVAFNSSVYNCTFLQTCAAAVRETSGSHKVCNSLILCPSATGQGGDFVNCVFGYDTATNKSSTAVKFTDCVKAATAAESAVDKTTFMPDGGSLAVDTANPELLPEAYGDYDFRGTNRTIGVGLDVGAVENDYVRTVEAAAIEGVTYEGVDVGTNRRPVPFTFTVRKGVTKRPMTGIATNGVYVAFDPDGAVTFDIDAIGGAISVTTSPTEPVTWYVDEKLGTDDNPIGYRPGADAFATLQAAMENPNLLAGDTVSVAEGVYSNGYYRIEATDSKPICDSRVRVKEGVRLVASGRRGETVILGQAGATVGGLGPGAVRCAILGANAVLQGFTLKNGHAASTTATSDDYKGGGASLGSGAVVVDCDILDCKASRGGAGDGGKWVRCYFDGNACGHIGAGFYGSGSLYNCVIRSTSSSYFGCTTAFYYCTFLAETVEVMRGLNASCQAVNCLILGGTADASGNGYLKRCAYPDSVKLPAAYEGHALDCIRTNAAAVAIDATTREPESGTVMIDAADESLVTFPAGYGDTDFNGKPRKFGSAMDIGAVEWQGCGLFVAEPPAGVTYEGVTVGKNPYVMTPFTFKVRRAAAGGRLASRVVLAGRTHFFGESDELTLTVEDTQRDAELSVPDLTTWHVDEKLGSDANEGLRPGTGALATLQAAAVKASSGEIVLVAEGVYSNNVKQVAATKSTPAYAVRVSVPVGVSFIATGRRGETVIRGQRGTETDLGADAIRCVNLGAGALLQGFTVTDGSAVSEGSIYNSGGGVAAASDAKIVDCDIVNCKATRAGAGTGGIWIRCFFNKNSCTSNIATGLRSASACYDCVIGEHTSYFCWDGDFYNCTFLPTCSYAFRNTESTPHGNLFNCLVLSPNASDQGGVFKNCVFGKDTKFSKTQNWSTNEFCRVAKSADEVAYDPATFEPLKGTLMMESADETLYDFPEGFAGTDLHGNPRVLGAGMDVGAVEYDWRKDFSKDIGRKLVVTDATPGVVEGEAKSVLVPDGGEVVVGWSDREKAPKGRIFRFNVTDGTLTVKVNGEAVVTFTSGGEWKYVNGAATDTVSFSFVASEEDGSAEILRSATDAGVLLIVR